MYKEIAKHKALFDTSNYPKQHFLFDEQNKKIVGKMKDETAGKLIENQLLLLYIYFNLSHAFYIVILFIGCPIKGFVGLRPKMYSFIVHDGKESQVKKAKGVSKTVVNRELTYHEYVECLFNGEFKRHKMSSIRSDNHYLYLKAINKISISSFDDKRY